MLLADTAALPELDQIATWVSEAIEESRPALEAWAPNVAKRRTIAEVAVGLAALEVAWTTSRKLVYGIYERPGGGFIGEAGLYRIDWQRRVIHAASIGAVRGRCPLRRPVGVA